MRAAAFSRVLRRSIGSIITRTPDEWLAGFDGNEGKNESSSSRTLFNFSGLRYQVSFGQLTPTSAYGLHEDPDYPNRRHLTIQCGIHILSTMAVLVIFVDVHRISFD
jgi:hypothetical protein